MGNPAGLGWYRCLTLHGNTNVMYECISMPIIFMNVSSVKKILFLRVTAKCFDIYKVGRVTGQALAIMINILYTFHRWLQTVSPRSSQPQSHYCLEITMLVLQNSHTIVRKCFIAVTYA